MEVITKAKMEYLSRENTNYKNNSDSIGNILNRPKNLLIKNLNTLEVNNDETMNLNTLEVNNDETMTISTSNFCPDNYVQRHDIAFKNLTYSVKAGFWSKDNKIILREINGNFKSGELSAIMGPSGAGKSSLLNILAGYTTHNITGVITINDELRELKKFLPQSAYIKQDTDLQPFLTVGESMHFSANLKLGKILSQVQKKERIKNVLEAIGLYDARRTRTGKLSGGQKKRLSIALELMSNPPVLILDEPTSGLDSSTSTQCISLLKKLAMEGRTIICTIHQPSALVFGMFDHLFAIAEGRCIFSGGTENVIPFLQELNLKCPESYNPSDYLLEISTNDYGYENERLVDQIQNGLCENYRKRNQTKNQIEIMGKVDRMMESGLITPVNAPFISILANSSLAPITEVSSIWGSHTTEAKKKASIQIDSSLLCKIDNRYPASFCRQLSILLMRTFLILWRNKSLSTMRILIHAAMGLFVGLLYYGIGNDASNVFNNFKYIFFSIMFIMYSAFSSIILNFPLEFPIVSREHFNRWYSLRAYYVALTLADVPIQLICTSIFIGISYLLTSQPLEILRILLFFTMIVMSALVAQSIGLAVGAFLSVKNGAILGPFFICPFLIFSGFFIQMQDVHDAMHWLFHISFLKYTLEGSTIAIFGFARPKMDCKEMYCHFIRPKKFLQAVGLENGNYEFSILALIIIFLSLRILSFYIMSFRLRLFR